MENKITFFLNGKEFTADVPPLKRLIDVLREDAGLTGTKEGCGEGECGACAVLAEGRLVNSCLMTAAMAQSRHITTIEGLRDTERFRVLKECYEEQGAVQCGFCTPGILLASEAILSENPHPGEEEIRVALSGNLCRCTGYTSIIKAVMTASERGAGLW